MKRLDVILGAATLIALLAVVAYLISDQSSEPLPPGKADTKLNIKLTLNMPGEGIKSQDMDLVCQAGRPLPQTKGFNLDVPRQAKRACRTVKLLKSGDQRCSQDSQEPESEFGSIEGIRGGKPFKAQYAATKTQSCRAAMLAWLRFARVWAGSGKIPKAEAEEERNKSLEGLKKSLAEGKKLKKQRLKEYEKFKRSVKRQEELNKKYAAPDAKTTGTPAPLPASPLEPSKPTP